MNSVDRRAHGVAAELSVRHRSSLFNEIDLWQHPSSFEELRRGDCEDFALWAWRKLAELGIDAEFFVGRILSVEEPDVDRQHAWVVFRVGDVQFLSSPQQEAESS